MIKIEWEGKFNQRNKYSLELDNTDNTSTIEFEIFYFLMNSLNYNTFRNLSKLMLKDIIAKAGEDESYKNILKELKEQIVLKEL